MSGTRHHGDKAKERTFKDKWRWCSQTPGWWNTLFHHRPKRREHGRLIHKVLRGEEELIWPLDKRPHKYYW